MTGKPRPRPSRRSHFRRGAVVACALTALALLGGCGLRAETAPPTEPVPDAHEQVRAAAVTAAHAVAAAARASKAAAPSAAVRDTLERAAVFADDHVAALGGVYDSGLGRDYGRVENRHAAGSSGARQTPAPSTAATPAPSTAATPAPSTAPERPGAVVALLTTAAKEASASAERTTDAGLARLLASIAAADTITARQLAAQLKAAGTADVPVPPTPPAAVPANLPKGLQVADLSVLIAQEDAAGYALEVRAAQSSGTVRSQAVDRAAVHRDRAEAWARAARVAETATDPRRTAYEVPDGDARTVGAGLETALAASYATLVALSKPGARSSAIALLGEAQWAAIATGAAPVALPGYDQQPTARPAGGASPGGASLSGTTTGGTSTDGTSTDGTSKSAP